MYVRFVVGRNGVGKSQYLIDVARRHSKNAMYVCNTVHDRSPALKGVPKFSAKNSKSRPNNVIKTIILKFLKEGVHRLHQIERILLHCRYQPRITIEIEAGPFFKSIDLKEYGLVDKDLRNFVAHLFERSARLEYEIEFGKRDFIELSELAMLLASEAELRKAGLISSIKISLFKDDGRRISLLKASSGELSLITSAMFMLAEVNRKNLLLIDEPENSLHPRWQREYISILYDLLGYHDLEIYVATHSPLIVAGTHIDTRVRSEIYHPETGQVEYGLPENIEDVLWGQFDIISPASRFLSEKLAETLEALSNGEISLETAVKLINKIGAASFDSKQENIFIAAKKLAIKIDQERKNVSRSIDT
jgi:hypothetical protein